MARLEMIRPYVEKVLTEYFETDKLIVDEDGDIPCRAGSAWYLIRLLDGDPPIVQMYSPVLSGVTKTPELLEEINTINADIRFARMFWVNDDIMIATELLAETIDKEELENACGAIAGIADHYDDELQKKYGGKRSFEEDPTQQSTDGGEAPASV